MDIGIFSINLKNNVVTPLKLINIVKFQCIHCGLCCRLGGPRLTNSDIKMLENVGYDSKLFLDTLEETRKSYKSKKVMKGILKSKLNGECIFLKRTSNSEKYFCSIYEHRPILCRLYPFDWELIKTENEHIIILLKLLSSCLGINAKNGEPVDASFLRKHLADSINKLFRILRT